MLLYPLVAAATMLAIVQYRTIVTMDSAASEQRTLTESLTPPAVTPAAVIAPSPLAVPTTASSPTRTPKLADGCYHVFLDVGANLGVHARFLYEPDHYPDATLARGWFDDQFGPAGTATNTSSASSSIRRDNRDICVFAFEPNPQHRERLLSLQKAYAAIGWRYTPILAGVSDHDGSMTFTHSRDTLGRGFAARPQGKNGNSKGIDVPVHRLASWLQREVEGRVLPERVYGKYAGEEPKVVMKLDVETLEYIVLPDLLLSGALCNVVDRVFGEVHYQFFPLTFENNGPFVLNKAKEAKAYFMDQLKLMKISRHCKTTWTTEDDESHSQDGVPFPTPKQH